MLVLGLLLFSTAPPLLLASACTDWKSMDLKKPDIPLMDNGQLQVFIEESQSVEVQGTRVHYREAGPPDGKILFLLHGSAFNSQHWKDIKTIQTMAAAGNKVYAVDLPGRGKTRSAGVGDRPSFMRALIKAVLAAHSHSGRKVVVVSPSYSGAFSIPLLISDPDLFCGFVPVAPGSASSFQDKFSSISVPTMIVVGERDGKSSSRALEKIPTSTRMHVIPDAGHPAYLDNPVLWNTMLYNFMRLDCVRCNGDDGDEIKVKKTSKRSASHSAGWADAVAAAVRQAHPLQSAQWD